MSSTLKPLFVAGCAVLLAAGIALADATEIRLTSLRDFEKATIRPVQEWHEALEGLHPGKRESFRVPRLHVVEQLILEDGSVADDRPGLIMAWGTRADQGEIIAAWHYQLPQDPDLTGMCITLTAWPRGGMTSISFSLVDVNGDMKGWSWPVGGSGLPAGVPTTLTIVAAGGPGQAGSTGFVDTGIDLTQIVAFEFDEGGVAQGGIPVPNNLGGWVGQWNYWHDIIVFPCPAAGSQPEHFTCYKVRRESYLEPITVSLVDQFHAEDGIKLGKAREICAPVDKNGEGVLDDRTHYVCYDVYDHAKVKKLVKMTNQFGEQELRIRGRGRILRLCVPSTKEVLR